MILSVVVGCMMGVVAIVIKSLTRWSSMLTELRFTYGMFYDSLYIVLPSIGILLSIIYVKYVIRQRIGHGIPSVLYAISKSKGDIKRHNVFSSMITSAITVGFGGSVGLEGPTVATGGALSSQISRFFGLSHKHSILLIGCAAAGAMAAIFKAPIAAIVFAVEVIMLDLTMASIVPLLLASISATLVSYLFTGQNVLYTFTVTDKFALKDVLHFIVFGVACGLVSAHFTRMYMWLTDLFLKIKKQRVRWILGTIGLGGLIFLFPSLYGEGYEAVNSCLAGDVNYIFDSSTFREFKSNGMAMLGIVLAIVVLKVVATSITLGAGGVGGIFAPTLFTGVHLGFLYATTVNMLGIAKLSVSNYALIGMAGLIAAVLHAPLTAIFLIADITNGYELLVPLMIVSTISYATVRIFHSDSVYTVQLRKRGELLTHDMDHNILTLMSLESLVEEDFIVIKPEDKLRALVANISKSRRNIFPVVNDNGELVGIVHLDHVREIMFQPDEYDNVVVSSLMISDLSPVDFDKDGLKEVAAKFHQLGLFNLPVIARGRYVGFVSRSRVFSQYQQLMQQMSED